MDEDLIGCSVLTLPNPSTGVLDGLLSMKQVSNIGENLPSGQKLLGFSNLYGWMLCTAILLILDVQPFLHKHRYNVLCTSLCESAEL